MKFIKFLFILLTSAVFLISCDDNSMNPTPSDDESEKPPEQGQD